MFLREEFRNHRNEEMQNNFKNVHFLSVAIDNTVTLDDVSTAGLLRNAATGHEGRHITMLLWA